MYSTVMILPAHLREKGDLLAAALGYGEQTFTVPLGGDAEGQPGDVAQEPTHYGCHVWASDSFIQLIVGASQGQLPLIDWEAHGLTVADVQQVLHSLIVSAPGSALDDPETPSPLLGLKPRQHFAAVAATINGD